MLFYSGFTTFTDSGDIFDIIKDESLWVKFFTDALIQEDYASKYAKIFVNNQITVKMLPYLNESLLDKMGITIVGHWISILMHAKEQDSKYFSLLKRGALRMSRFFYYKTKDNAL